MTQTITPAERAWNALDAIRANPAEWDQDFYRCDTGAMCFAGHVADQDPDTVWANPYDAHLIRSDGRGVSAMERALELLLDVEDPFSPEHDDAATEILGIFTNFTRDPDELERHITEVFGPDPRVAVSDPDTTNGVSS